MRKMIAALPAFTLLGTTGCQLGDGGEGVANFKKVSSAQSRNGEP